MCKSKSCDWKETFPFALVVPYSGEWTCYTRQHWHFSFVLVLDQIWRQTDKKMKRVSASHGTCLRQASWIVYILFFRKLQQSQIYWQTLLILMQVYSLALKTTQKEGESGPQGRAAKVMQQDYDFRAVGRSDVSTNTFYMYVTPSQDTNWVILKFPLEILLQWHPSFHDMFYFH